jgi:lipopolysaccharide transport system ATP-binding protein
MSSSDIAISISNLSKAYTISHGVEKQNTLAETILDRVKNPFRRSPTETFWALKDVSFNIDKGEVVGIVGRNGAGKSTLLKILSRITEPTKGQVEIWGRVGCLLEVGTGFHGELTGRENIFLNGAILGMTKGEIRKQFDAIIDFAGVEKFLDTPVKRYSSGMYVRLAFAVAAHLNTEILIVDEVLAVGDAEFQKKCLGKMGEISKGGRTVLFVSHNMAAITNLCSKTIWLRRGEVVLVGETASVVRQYAESMSESTAVSVRQAKEGRSGNGQVRFTDLTLLSEDGKTLPEAVSGRPLRLRLSYEADELKLIPNFRVSVCFFDSVGQVLFNCSSELVPNRLKNIPGSGAVDLMIDKLPLTAGTYQLNLFFEVDGVIADYLLGGVSLNVVDGNFYGAGRDYPPGWEGKGVLVPHSWAIG